jgi:hypothetical protein
MSKDKKIVDVHQRVSNKYRTDEKQMVPGFSTTVSTRPLIINKLDMYMRDRENKAITIKSLRLIEELRVFIWDGGKAQAEQGYNDDLILSLCIGLWVRDVALRLKMEGVELTKRMLDSIQKTGEGEAPSAVYIPGHMGYDPYKLPLGNINNNPLAPNKEDEDLRWLL